MQMSERGDSSGRRLNSIFVDKSVVQSNIISLVVEIIFGIVLVF